MRKKSVRTTITLRRDHQVLLRTLAAQRGQRGFSKIVAEALDFYFQEKAAKEVESLFKPKRQT